MVRIDIFRIATKPQFSDSAWKVSHRTKISLSQVYPVSHGSWSKFDRRWPFWHTWLQVLKLHYLVTPWSFFKNSKTTVLGVEQALNRYALCGIHYQSSLNNLTYITKIWKSSNAKFSLKLLYFMMGWVPAGVIIWWHSLNIGAALVNISLS